MCRYLVVVFFILLLMTGCHSISDTEDQCVFRYNQPNNVTSLDPAFARNQSNIWAVDHLYNTLVQLDDSLVVRPCLATSWTIDSSGCIYDFVIDRTVMFHDDPCFADGRGRTMLAEDVVYSLNRIIDAEVASPGSWIFSGRIDTIRPFEALNDSVVRIRLLRPFMPFLQLMSMQYCSVVPKEAVDTYGRDFRSHPVGTGPFRLKKWIEGQTMILHKNEHYFEFDHGNRLPYVDIVRISFIGDRKTAFLKLQEGNIDFMSGFDPSMANELMTRDGELRAKYSRTIHCHKSPYLNTEYLGINLASEEHNSPLLHRDFRRGLNYGFDRKALLQTIKRGIGTPAFGSFTPYGLPSYDEDKLNGYAYDPAKARQFIKQSGYYDLQEAQRPVLKLFTAKDYSDHCLFIAKQWEQLGVKTQIELAEAATVREMMRHGQATFFRASWLADYPDAENYLTVFYGENPAPPNYTRFKHEGYDAMYRQALITSDLNQRYDLYNQMEQILLDEAPVIFLYYDAITNFTTDKIVNYHPNPLNLLKVKYIKKNCHGANQ